MHILVGIKNLIMYKKVRIYIKLYPHNDKFLNLLPQPSIYQ